LESDTGAPPYIILPPSSEGEDISHMEPITGLQPTQVKWKLDQLRNLRLTFITCRKDKNIYKNTNEFSKFDAKAPGDTAQHYDAWS
jgi:hypothetical protein